MTTTDEDECVVCKSVAGAERISPGAVVLDGQFWMVEHAYPTALLGWLVIVLKRHAVALHELTNGESIELGRLQIAVASALHEATGCLKEYSACFGEADGFAHVHFHLVPRAVDFDSELRGRGVFALIKPGRSDIVPPEVVARFCVEMRSRIETELDGPLDSPPGEDPKVR